MGILIVAVLRVCGFAGRALVANGFMMDVFGTLRILSFLSCTFVVDVWLLD